MPRLPWQWLRRGKHVYTEKPIVVQREDGLKLLEAAKQKGVRVGGAPDTFFGSAWQTARKLIDDGVIGKVIGAHACLHDARKPGVAAARPQNADGYVSFYRTHYWEYGAGASFDRGPYYLNALIHLLGPVCRVSGSTAMPFAERDRAGAMFEVHAPTHVVGLLDFCNGAICTFTHDLGCLRDQHAPHRDLWHRRLLAADRSQQLLRRHLFAASRQPRDGAGRADVQL